MKNFNETSMHSNHLSQISPHRQLVDQHLEEIVALYSILELFDLNKTNEVKEYRLPKAPIYSRPSHPNTPHKVSAMELDPRMSNHTVWQLSLSLTMFRLNPACAVFADPFRSKMAMSKTEIHIKHRKTILEQFFTG